MTLSILAIKQSKRDPQLLKTMRVYLGVVLFCILFDRIYALFGHGVFSASMSFMFLYPLLLGCVPYFLLWLWIQKPEGIRHFSLLQTIWNAGIATLTIKSALKGVFDIAGTSSPYLIYFTVLGIILLNVSLLFFLHDLRQINSR